MKRIRRLQEPIPGLADYRRQAGAHASWEGYRRRPAGQKRHRKLVENLADLQHGLCGYCEIDLREEDRQVEHVIPVSDPHRGPAHALDAGNLIACCRGGVSDAPEVQQDPKRFPPSQKSCGHAKGGKVDPAFVDPRTLPDLPSLMRVRPNDGLNDGLIEADVGTCQAAGRSADDVERTIQLLGLNVPQLKRARQDHWSNLSHMMPLYRDHPDAIEQWARRNLLPDIDGNLFKFFTTTRSYFGELGERVLAEEPRDWI